MATLLSHWVKLQTIEVVESATDDNACQDKDTHSPTTTSTFESQVPTGLGDDDKVQD